MKNIYSILLSAFITQSFIAQTCTPPTLVVPNTSTCVNSPATLTANTTAQVVNWYDSATSTTPIFTGNPFVTPPISATTTYWAEASNYILGAQVTGGKSTPGTSSTAVVAGTSPWGLAFTVNTSFLLESVDVFASANGNLVLELLDANYATLESRTIAITTGGTSTAPTQITIPVGFNVTAGNSYKLVARSSPSMRRDTGTNSFPYDLGGLGTITGGTINSGNTNSGVYYFFYNWKVSPYSGLCTSSRVQTTITTASAAAAPIATSPQTFNTGATLADLTVNGQNLTWYADAALTTVLPTTTPLVSGTTYYVTQTVNGCRSAATAIVANLALSTLENNLNIVLKTFPNPVSDVLNIESTLKIKNVQIVDSSGKLIYSQSAKGDKEMKLKVSDYPNGKYILNIETEQSKKAIPFIKK